MLVEIVLLINGVIKVLSLTWHELTAMDEVLGSPPGSRIFHNEWQLLPARLGGIRPPAKDWFPNLCSASSPSPSSVSKQFGFQFVDPSLHPASS